MPVRGPTHEQLVDIIDQLNMSMNAEEVAFFRRAITGLLDAYEVVEQMPDYIPEVTYPRTPGYKPHGDENPYNAWYVKSEIRGSADGPLAGKTIAVKDNVQVAGVPMRNGASTLEGFTPNLDATIVTRMLDAGGTIKGKAVCEYFCFSGGSHTSTPAPVINPRKAGYSAGGSSSGSAALLAAGDVDMAIGGDQGGSIRMPSAYCGVYGMKPTYGLVPYSGVMPVENTIDHTGPMTTTVADNALLLEVLAGEDGLDPRQYSVKTHSYTEALGLGVSGLKIGVLTEGFGHESSEADVDAKVRAAADKLGSLGARISEVSVPMHLKGTAIWTPIATEGSLRQLMQGNGMGMNWKGLYSTALLDAHANWRMRADEFSHTLKICLLLGEFTVQQHRGHYYAKAQNQARLLKETYLKTLEEVDLLLMPTVPMKATKLPRDPDDLEEYLARAFENLPNTAPFDITGNPAMAIPCGQSDGLPISMMLVGRHFDEPTIYKAAHAFEQSGDWQSM